MSKQDPIQDFKPSITPRSRLVDKSLFVRIGQREKQLFEEKATKLGYSPSALARALIEEFLKQPS
jgi:hypothetical protein